MKACKLCEVFDHQQQKINDGKSGGKTATNNTDSSIITSTTKTNNNNISSIKANTDNSVNDKTDKENNNNKSEVQSRCSHRFGTAAGVDVLPTFGMFPPNLRDVFLAAELLRGELMIYDFSS